MDPSRLFSLYLSRFLPWSYSCHDISDDVHDTHSHTACPPHCERHISALSLVFMSSFLATVTHGGLPWPETGIRGVEPFGGGGLAQVAVVASSSPMLYLPSLVALVESWHLHLSLIAVQMCSRRTAQCVIGGAAHHMDVMSAKCLIGSGPPARPMSMSRA